MASKLIEIRRPTPAERKRGADVVFIRKDDRYEYTILAARCQESWEQWGAETSVLGDNVDAVEAWRRGRLTGGDL